MNEKLIRQMNRFSSEELNEWHSIFNLLVELVAVSWMDFKIHYQNKYNKDIKYRTVLHFAKLELIDIFENKNGNEFIKLTFDTRIFDNEKRLKILYSDVEILELLKLNNITGENFDFSKFKWKDLSYEIDYFHDF